MVARKTGFVKSQEKKLIEAPRGRKPGPGKIDALEDAYRDGAWTVPIGGDVIVERSMGGRRQRSICVVRKIEERLVETWDETLDRWFSFNPADLEPNGILAKVPSK